MKIKIDERIDNFKAIKTKLSDNKENDTSSH